MNKRQAKKAERKKDLLIFREVIMNKERMEEIIKKEFGVGSISSPFGSCTEDFLNNKIIEVAKKNNFPEDIIELFQKHPYIFPKYKKYDNGEGAGRYYINLLGIYLNP